MNSTENLAVGLLVGVCLALPVGYMIGRAAMQSKIEAVKSLLRRYNK